MTMRQNTKPPFIVIAHAGHINCAQRINDALGDAILAGPKHLNERVDINYYKLSIFLQSSFSAGHPIIWIGATSIPIRLLAPVIGSKHTDPPVIAVSSCGQTIIPLLGLHRGGDVLAASIAASTQGKSQGLTSLSRRLGLALDHPPHGWLLADDSHYTNFAGRILAGDKVTISDYVPWLDNLDSSPNAPLSIMADIHSHPPTPDCLHYIPQCLALGIGCIRGARLKDLESLILSVLETDNIDSRAIAGIFSIDLKIDEQAILDLGQAWSLPVRFFPAERLERETPRLQNPSKEVFTTVGCHGVAEAAALAAVGPRGDLLRPKTKGNGVTIAIGQNSVPFDPLTLGRGRGRLDIISLGPGSDDLRSERAKAALLSAQTIIGYGPYIDQISHLIQHKNLHRLNLGQEEERARLSLKYATKGQMVALVSSGDVGIYAMAAVVFDVLSHMEAKPPIDITVIPGITAMQAASAKIGAFLAHDFCAISLSDLQTPWGVIEKKLHHSAKADFIINLYNPTSKTRFPLLIKALSIIRQYRPSDTPVIIARSVERADENIHSCTLESIDPADVDMHSLVMIGIAATTSIDTGSKRYFFVPRDGQKPDHLP